MRSRFAVLAILISLAAVPLSAQAFYPDEVILQTVGDPFQNAWMAGPGWTWAGACCTGGIPEIKAVPFVGAGQLLIPSGRTILFHDRHAVSWWNGGFVYYEDPREAYTYLFSDEAELTEIAPMRSGHFVLAEAPADRGAKLIEFDVRGKLAEHAFPGARHIDLTSDGCTLLYTNGAPAVHRFNLCTDQPETDFVALRPDESAGAVREMPNGDVLVAANDGVKEFRANGSFWMFYPFPGVTHVALSSDGQRFWAAGIANRTPILRYFDPGTVTSDLVRIGNHYDGSLDTATAISALTVACEWRASMPVARSRGVRHR